MYHCDLMQLKQLQIHTIWIQLLMKLFETKMKNEDTDSYSTWNNRGRENEESTDVFFLP